MAVGRLCTALLYLLFETGSKRVLVADVGTIWPAGNKVSHREFQKEATCGEDRHAAQVQKWF